jgi:hypothetical protein
VISELQVYFLGMNIYNPHNGHHPFQPNGERQLSASICLLVPAQNIPIDLAKQFVWAMVAFVPRVIRPRR